MIVFAVCDDEPFMLDDVVSRLSRYAEERHIEHKILSFHSGNELLESKQAKCLESWCCSAPSMLTDVSMMGFRQNPRWLR